MKLFLETHCPSYQVHHWLADIFIIDLTNDCDARRASRVLSSYGQEKFAHSVRSTPGRMVGVAKDDG